MSAPRGADAVASLLALAGAQAARRSLSAGSPEETSFYGDISHDLVHTIAENWGAGVLFLTLSGNAAKVLI